MVDDTKVNIERVNDVRVSDVRVNDVRAGERFCDGGVVRVCDVMSCYYVVVKLYEGLRSVVKYFLERRVSCVIVVDDEGRPFQVLVPRDILRVYFYWLNVQLDVSLVFDVLKYLGKDRRNLLVIEKDESLVTALEIMRRYGISHLPVVDEEGNLVGILQGSEIFKKFPEVVYVDSLTELPNRGYLSLIEKKIQTKKGQIGVLFIDIDDFKKINDNYGHDIGDKALIEVAKTLKSNIRLNDEVVRLGGEEFLVVLYRCSSEEALYEVSERLRKAIEQINVFDFKITISIGAYLMKNNENLYDAIPKANKAMHLAKKSGKNKVVIFNT